MQGVELGTADLQAHISSTDAESDHLQTHTIRSSTDTHSQIIYRHTQRHTHTHTHTHTQIIYRHRVRSSTPGMGNFESDEGQHFFSFIPRGQITRFQKETPAALQSSYDQWDPCGESKQLQVPRCKHLRGPDLDYTHTNTG